MKNRSCPDRIACFDYDADNCEGCPTGEYICKLQKKIRRLKAKNNDLEVRNEVLQRDVDNLMRTVEEGSEELKDARRHGKWLWDYEEDAPKCSLCGGRAMYQPHQNGNGEKLCFITLSLYCPHCGAEMEEDMCEEDTDEYREQEEKELSKETTG